MLDGVNYFIEVCSIKYLVLNMEKKIKILPAAVKVEKISLLEFLGDLPEIIKSAPDLSGTKASTITLSHPKGSISMSSVAEDAFTISADPDVLSKLVDAAKRYYEKKSMA